MCTKSIQVLKKWVQDVNITFKKAKYQSTTRLNLVSRHMDRQVLTYTDSNYLQYFEYFFVLMFYTFIVDITTMSK